MAAPTLLRQSLRASPKVGLLVAFMAAVASPAAGQQKVQIEVGLCGPSDGFPEMLARDIGEHLRATGELPSGALLELYVSDDFGRFTVIWNDGKARCVMGIGENLTLIPKSETAIRPGNDT